MNVEMLERREFVPITREVPVERQRVPSYIDAEFETIDAKKLDAARREIQLIEYKPVRPQIAVIPVEEPAGEKPSLLGLLFGLFLDWLAERRESQ